MTDKELNKAILNELYKIADEVWASMKKDVVGSFTASHIDSKHLYRDMYFSIDQSHHVEVDNFRCAFNTCQIFNIVAKFEVLAGVGSKRHLFIAESKGKVEASVTFAVIKELEELCDFTTLDGLRPSYAFIFIDAERNCLVATNGHSMKVCPVTFYKKKGDTSDMRILAADFKKMCAKMRGKNVYQMTATKERTDDDICTNIMFEGIAAMARHRDPLPKWHTVFKDCSSELCLDVQNWKAVNKLAKMNKGEDVMMCGKCGGKTILFRAGNCELRVENGEVLKHSFCVIFGTEHFLIAKKAESMRLYLGISDITNVEAVDNSGNLYVLCPKAKKGHTFVGEYVKGELIAPYVECDINLLDFYVLNAKCTVKVASRKAPTTTKQKTKVVAKKADKPASKKQVDHSRKFTFAAIGVRPGDKLTFVDGTEVVAMDDNKVAYEGSTYTLSGFCKTFMPDAKRNKSNSYRGCVFFYRNGVKLEKLFNDALKVEERPTEVAPITETPQVKEHAETETPQVKEEWHVTVCADTHTTIFPYWVRAIPSPILRPANYPSQHLWRCGAHGWTWKRKSTPALRGWLNRKNVHTFALPPPSYSISILPLLKR